MPLNLDFIRHFRTMDRTFSNYLAPGLTTAATTSYLGTEVDCSGFGSGVFFTQVTSNASAGVNPQDNQALYLQQRFDTTNWITFATIHPDFTTTANNRIETVEFEGDYLRTMIPAGEVTSSVICSFMCYAKLKGV